MSHGIGDVQCEDDARCFTCGDNYGIHEHDASFDALRDAYAATKEEQSAFFKRHGDLVGDLILKGLGRDPKGLREHNEIVGRINLAADAALAARSKLTLHCRRAGCPCVDFRYSR